MMNPASYKRGDKVFSPSFRRAGVVRDACVNTEYLYNIECPSIGGHCCGGAIWRSLL
jgi:hypothetical protein